MGGGGGGGGGVNVNYVCYAPYVETAHKSFLTTVQAQRNLVIGKSPFKGYEDIEVDDAFFGAGYIISSFPSLYDMYGKFMAGLDIEALWSQIFEDTINSPQVADLSIAEAALLDDDIAINSLPRLQTGMRLIRTSFLCRGVYLAVSCMSRIFGPQDIGDGSSERIGTVLRASSFYDLIP